MRRTWLLLCLALAASSAGAQQERPAPQAPASAADGRRADIAVFREQFLARDRSYSDAARKEAEARLFRLEADAASVSPAYFELELARIVALADNGHTMLFAGPRSRRYNRVEVRLVPFGEEFYVLRAKAASADLLGARLVAIDGHPVAEVRKVARTLMGGIPAWRDRDAGYFLESPEQMQALGVIEAGEAATYRFALVDDATVERKLAAEPPDLTGPRANSVRWLYPDKLDRDGDAWRTLIAPESAPWALQDLDEPFRFRDAPELEALVIQLRQNTSSPGHAIEDFLRDMTGKIGERKPQNLVLDMRLNGGGDLNDTRDFVQRLPRLVPGRIFVLTSPWTFSAAISTTGYLEQAAPERVIIVGEPVGDRLQMWAEGRVFELPHSKAAGLNATERHDYLTGCKPFADCHGPVVRNPIAVASLDPDIAAPWTLDAYRAGRDPAIEAVTAALSQGSIAGRSGSR